MLGKRIITAVIGIPLAIFLISYGKWLYVAVVAMLSLGAWHEYRNMFSLKEVRLSNLAPITILLLLACAWLGNFQEIFFLFILAALVLFIQTVTCFDKFNWLNAAITMLGIIYIGGGFLHLILLRFIEIYGFGNGNDFQAGAAFVGLAFIGTWASDSLAFFVGSAWGKHKLCPAISPAKTVEGAIGGLVGSIAAVVAVGYLLLKINSVDAVVIGTLIGIAAPLGDLAESSLKRFVGVKDSGRILPGHGGILDRFDSILFVAPAIYYYLQFTGLH